MSITPAQVKELRERTGAGMMDCKKALDESSGNMDAAIDWLRKKGLAAAAKKAGRAAAEGLVAVAVSNADGVIVEVNAETDFVSRNDKFQEFVSTISPIALSVKGNLDALKKAPYPGTDRTVEEELTHLIAVVGENMSLRRAAHLSVPQGVISSYIHSGVSPTMGRIGVLVALESASDSGTLSQAAKEFSMHIAANNPQVLRLSDITEEQKSHEREVLKDQVRATLEKIEAFIIGNMVPAQSGSLTVKEVNKAQFEKQSKALAKRIREEIQGKESISIERIKQLALEDDVIQQTVDADLDKFINQSALYEQPFVMNPKKKIAEVIEEISGKNGSPVQIKGFIRFELGEGIEKKVSNFAEEVAAQLS